MLSLIVPYRNMQVCNIKRYINIVTPIVINEYIAGSDLEKEDIRKSYVDGKGQMKYIIRNVPFLTSADELRVIKVINGK